MALATNHSFKKYLKKWKREKEIIFIDWRANPQQSEKETFYWNFENVSSRPLALFLQRCFVCHSTRKLRLITRYARGTSIMCRWFIRQIQTGQSVSMACTQCSKHSPRRKGTFPFDKLTTARIFSIQAEEHYQFVSCHSVTLCVPNEKYIDYPVLVENKRKKETNNGYLLFDIIRWIFHEITIFRVDSLTIFHPQVEMKTLCSWTNKQNFVNNCLLLEPNSCLHCICIEDCFTGKRPELESDARIFSSIWMCLYDFSYLLCMNKLYAVRCLDCSSVSFDLLRQQIAIFFH